MIWLLGVIASIYESWSIPTPAYWEPAERLCEVYERTIVGSCSHVHVKATHVGMLCWNRQYVGPLFLPLPRVRNPLSSSALQPPVRWPDLSPTASWAQPAQQVCAATYSTLARSFSHFLLGATRSAVLRCNPQYLAPIHISRPIRPN